MKGSLSRKGDPMPTEVLACHTMPDSQPITNTTECDCDVDCNCPLTLTTRHWDHAAKQMPKDVAAIIALESTQAARQLTTDEERSLVSYRRNVSLYCNILRTLIGELKQAA
jgi:hypothetical protein